MFSPYLHGLGINLRTVARIQSFSVLIAVIAALVNRAQRID